MITLDTLRVINADLDAERREQLFIRADNTELLSKDVKEEDKESVGGMEEVAEERDDEENAILPDPEHTEHMKLLNRIIGYFNFMGIVFGVKIVFRWNWKQLGYFIGSTTALIALVFMLYTAYFHYVNGDKVRVLEPLVLHGVVISCIQKLFGTVKHMESIAALLLSFRTKSRRIDQRSGRGSVLRNGFLETLSLMKIFTFGVILSASLVLIIPLKVYITDRVVIPLLPMEFSFLNSNTTLGVLTGNLLHSTMGLYASIGTTLYGLSFIVLVSFYGIEGESLVEDFKDLDNMWTGKTEYSVAHRHAFLRNICIKRQDMNRYLKTIKTIYETKLFYYFCANYFSQILALFQILMNDWQGGIGLACALLIEMMFYCVMGTKVSKCDDRLCYIIYDTNWYEYDLISQKIVLMLLTEAQKKRDLRLKFIGPLNLVTFITIIKSMYTYYTVLSEVL